MAQPNHPLETPIQRHLPAFVYRLYALLSLDRYRQSACRRRPPFNHPFCPVQVRWMACLLGRVPARLIAYFTLTNRTAELYDVINHSSQPRVRHLYIPYMLR